MDDDDEITGRQRTLAVKAEINWKDEESKKLYERLRTLGWQAARYRNLFVQKMFAEKMGWRRDPAAADPHDLTKQARAQEKGELSGSAYSAAEREICPAPLRGMRDAFTQDSHCRSGGRTPHFLFAATRETSACRAFGWNWRTISM